MNEVAQVEDVLETNIGINVEEAYKMRVVNGLTFKQIGKHFKCSPQAVQQRLKNFLVLLDDPKAQAVYEQNTARLLNTGARILFTDMLDSNKRASASLNNTAYAFNTVYNASRLEAGKSNLNVSVRETAKGLLDKLNQLDDMEGNED